LIKEFPATRSSEFVLAAFVTSVSTVLSIVATQVWPLNNALRVT